MNMKWLKKGLQLGLACLLCLTSLTGCETAKTKIVYTVYPVGYLVSRLTDDKVMNESIQEEMIVQRAAIKENYEEILEDCAVFLHIGQLEPYLSLFSNTISGMVPEQIDLSTMNAVYDFQRYTQVVSGDEITYIEAPYYKDPAFDLVDVDIKDLYLWTDPIAMLSMAKNILTWLEKTYPEDTEYFEENLENLENDLINLDAQYQALATNNIANNKVIRFVSMTASFGNWQKTYGFEVYPVILSKYGVLPNVKQLEVIKKTILDNGIKYIVYEPNMTEDMIALFNELQEELSLTRVELSNLSSLTEEEDNDGKDYLSLMYENLRVLETMTEDRNALTPSEETPVVEENQVTQLPTPSPVPTPTPTPTGENG